MPRASLRVMDEEKREVRLQHLRQCVPVSTPDQTPGPSLAYSASSYKFIIMWGQVPPPLPTPLLPDWSLSPFVARWAERSSRLFTCPCRLYNFLSSVQTPNFKDPGAHRQAPPCPGAIGLWPWPQQDLTGLPSRISMFPTVNTASIELLTRHILMPCCI